MALLAGSASAQTPPFWNNGNPSNVNGSAGSAIKPVPWPDETQWIAYSWGTTYPDATIAQKHPIRDQRVQDPSNGGTTPQNYVNVSSGCPDQSSPSIYYYFDPGNRVVFFRWRVEQIANSYATTSTAGAYSSTDPWKSALWTVFLDLNGDGFRDFAMHLDGSSGGPSTPIDVLRSIWSPLKTNSIDYSQSGIYSLFTNPTAFVENTTQKIIQFNGNAQPKTVQWPNGASETIWDYGTTRSINISTSSCGEYFVDYEIPLAMLDSTAYTGGRKLDEYTPFQFLFATANSLNNPFQKDVVWEGGFVCDATSPGPFGDAMTLAGGIIPQPISTSITTGTPNGCIVPVTAQIMDALTVTNCASTSELVSAQFKYYYDINGDGIDNDGGQWQNIGDPAVPIGTTVAANWNTQNLIQGQYLVALEITDNRGHTTQTWQGKTNSPLTQPFCDHTTGCTNQALYTNVPPFQVSFPYSGLSAASYGISYTKVNVGGSCAAPLPTVTKTSTASNAGVTQGGQVPYTITLTNTSATDVTVSQIIDTLPTGFTYDNTVTPGGTLGTPTSTITGTGTVTWNFNNASLPGCSPSPCSSSKTFTFGLRAGTSGGTFFNTASVVTSVGTLIGKDTVGVPVRTATMIITKSVALASAPGTPVTVVNRGDTVRFTMTVTNNSQTAITGLQIDDPLPSGFTYVGSSVTSSPSATTSTPAAGANGTVHWTVGSTLAACSGTPCVGGGVWIGTVDAIATVPGAATNTATATSNETTSVLAKANLSVNGPVLKINKVASTSSIIKPVNPATVTVDYVLQYTNIGNGPATDVRVTDTVPAGFALVTGANTTTGCTQPGGSGTVVNCTSAPFPVALAAGATGTINLRFAVGSTVSTGSNTNTAVVTSPADSIPSAQATFTVQVDANGCTTKDYFFRSTTGSVSGAAGNGVAYVNMTSGGTGYTTVPTITFTGTGTGATGIGAAGAGTGQILGVNMSTAGTGYTAAPTVGFVGGGGTGAAGTAVLTSNVFLAQTTAGAANITSPTQTVGTNRELFRFYSDPSDTTMADANLISSASITTGWNMISNGTKLVYTATLYDFNPATNGQTQIATFTTPQLNAGNAFTETRAFTLPAGGYVLAAGHRLLWTVAAQDANGNHGTDVQFLYNGASATAFGSKGTVCMQPVRMSLEKRADKLEINPGIDQLTYTLQYNNPSAATVTTVSVTDTPPAGMTYVSSSTASGSISYNSGTNTITWTVGSVAAGGTGTATITLQTTTGVTGTGTPAAVTNTATLKNDYTPDVTASTSTYVASPDVRVAKRASGNNFVAGNSFTYTIDVVNAGNGVATGVSLADALPSYITATTATGPTTGIASITLTNPGSGYTTAPLVTIGGTGSGATATAVLNGSGGLSGIVVTNPGTGYTGTPTVTVAPPTAGTTAAGTAVLRSISISNPNVTFNIGSMAAGTTATLTINVTIASSGVPAGVNSAINTATVSGGCSTGPCSATAVVTVTATPKLSLTEVASTLALPLTSITVTTPGNYGTTAPTVTITGCTVQPTAVATLNSSGGISYVTITNPGAGCTAPVVSFSGSGGGAATASSNQTSGGLLNLTLLSGGSGYTTPPTVTVTGCTLAPTVTALLAGTSVSGFTITNAGSGCPAVPGVSISGTGSGANASAAGGERVVFVNVTSGGSYTSVPTVSISGAGCTGVTAAVSTNPPAGTGTTYSVTGVTITNPGSGCTGIPTVTFSGSGTGGAAATATIGPAPGDVITYTLTAKSTGDADVTGVVITGSVPQYTSYVSGGTFNGGQVTSTAVSALSPGSTTSLVYTVMVTSGLPYLYTSPFGVSVLSESGSASATNTTAPPTVSSSMNTGTSPSYTIAKTPDGDTLAHPLTTLTTAASNTTTLQVASSTLISVGDYIAIPSGSSYAVVQVKSRSGSIVTVSSPVTAVLGASVLPVQQYTLTYANSGGASGSNVFVRDSLPGGLLYGGTPLSTVASAVITNAGSGYASAPAVTIAGGGGSGATATATINGAGQVTAVIIQNNGSGYSSNPTITIAAPGGAGTTATATAVLTDPIPDTPVPAIGTAGATLTWTIGTLQNSTSGTVTLLAFAASTGQYTNTAWVSDDKPNNGAALNDRNAVATAQTTFGALNPSKITTTPQVTNTATGTLAHYTISVQNPLPSGNDATSTSVTDNLPAGFTYKNGTTKINGVAAADPCSSCASPKWTGLTITAGSTMTIDFDANVASTVASGVYQNEVLVTSSRPSLIFDYLATTQEDVRVCDAAPTVLAPAACATSTNNVASVPYKLQASYTWSINNGATITASSNGTVSGVVLNSGGSGYTTATVNFSGGGGAGASATASINNGAITGITIVSAGSGYSTAPTVAISGDGTGASATAVLGALLNVNSIAVGSGGSGYPANPTVTISAPTGTPAITATATATVVGGVVTGLTVTNPGAGYTSAPTVTISGGTGATTAAVLGTGIVYTAGTGSPTIGVTVTDGSCSVSASASPSVSGPAITAQPQSKTVCGSQNVSFSVTASGATSYQWYRSTDNGANFSAVGGATSATYTFAATSAANNNDQYRVVVTGSGCSTTSAAATLKFSCSPDLEMTTDSDSPDPVTAGSNITYTQLFTNIATQATDQTITLTETVPAGTTFVSFTPPANFTCTGVPAVGGTGTFTCTSSTSIAGGGNSGSFTFVVKTSTTATDGSTITDNVSVSTPNDTNTGNNANSATTTVTRVIDMMLGKTDDAVAPLYGKHFIYPGNPPAPQSMNWSITVANGGPSRASNIVVSDSMPFGFTESSAGITLAGNSCTYNANTSTVTCTVPTLDATPTVSFSGGGGSGASGVVTVAGGAVTGVVITNAGSGYTTAPTVTIATAGSGSGATATATLTSKCDVNNNCTNVVDSITINNGGTGYTNTPVITIGGTATVDTTQIINTATVTYNETDTNHANDPGTDTVTIVAPTLVKMLGMSAEQSKNGGATISWSTTFEQDNLGFYVWRQNADGTREKADPHIITGSALFTGKKITSGRNYRFVDRKVAGNALVQYWIEDVDLKGVHTMHGPVTPRFVTTSIGTAGSTDTDQTLGSLGGIFTTQPGMGVAAPAPSLTASATRQSQQWAISGNAGAKLVVTQNGWYRVKKSDLVAAGFDPGSNSNRIGVFADGVEVPILIPNGTFGTNDAIEFYGTALDTPTEGGHTYYVTNVAGGGLRIGAAKTGGGSSAPAAFPYTFSRTERTVYFSAAGDDSRDTFFGAIITTEPNSEMLTVANADANGGDATLQIVIQGVNENYDHAVALSMNGHDLGVVRFRGQIRKVATLPVPQAWLIAGENTLGFVATGGADDVDVVESAQITYAHAFRADANALAMTTPASTSTTVTGFTTAAVKVLDLTDPAAQVVVPSTATKQADGTYSVTFTSGYPGTRMLLAIGDDRIQAPAQIVVNQPSKLNAATNGADLVIISHKSFLSAANTLKAARDAQGISTMVIDVQNVYDEFSYGAHGPAAIRTMLQRASTAWAKAPKYVILMGDASWDPRNYEGFGNFDYMPTKLLSTYYLRTSSDDWFADFNDTDSPSMAIGRIPVRTLDEANGVVGKLVRRSAPPTDTWAKTVEIVTDHSGELPFFKSGETLAAMVPAPLTTDHIAIGNGDSTTLIKNAFNRGSLLTNYIGHGSIEIWSSYVFDSTMASQLTNGDKLPFVVTMNCLNGYFHDAFSESLGEALLKNANGGAIGVWASSALTSPDQQLLVNQELYRQIFGATSQPIGDAILKAKKATNDRDVRHTWILLGDPTMKVR